MNKPVILEGGLHRDSRGSLSFFNAFAFSGIERFYVIRPARPGFIRGWMGHQREHKWFSAVQGVVSIPVVQPDDWDSPSHSLPIEEFTLAAERPQILSVPPGTATAIVGVTPESALLVFSTGNIADAPSDAFRYPPEYWPLTSDKYSV